MKNKDYIQTNKIAWEEAYDKSTEAYKDIVSRLNNNKDYYISKRLIRGSVEEAIRGKDIAQLACNNGREVLSLGMHFEASSMTGFDLSKNMVDAAQSSANALGVHANFYERNLADIEPAFNENFDTIFILIGVLCWFDDLRVLTHVASRLLKTGGELFIYDGHPASMMMGLEQDEGYLPDYPTLPLHSYFKKEPFVETDGMGYLTDQAYQAKVPFTSFSYTFEALFKGLIKDGFNWVDFEEGNEDALENYPELDGQGYPLVFYLHVKKGV